MAIFGNIRSQEANFVSRDDGATATRVYIVELAGLNSYPTIPQDVLDEAADAVSVAPGSAEMIGGTTFLVKSKRARPIENGGAIQVNVEMEALVTEGPGLPITYSGTLATERTNLAWDPLDLPMGSFSKPIITSQGTIAEPTNVQPHLVDIMRPIFTWSRRYFVGAPPAIPNITDLGTPAQCINRFLGTVNTTIWGAPYQDRQVLITRMHVDNELIDGFYWIDVEFSINWQTWDVYVIQKDDKGRPVQYDTQAVDPPELRRYQMYRDEDFSLWGNPQ